jgi:O-methyltransferase
MIRYIKRGTKSLLHRFGYEILPLRPAEAEDTDFPVELTGRDSKYYTRWSTPCPLFAPWVGHPDFQKIYDGAAAYTKVPPHRCYMLISLAQYATHLKGDFAECGVQNGGTALLLSRLLKGRDKTLYLFDSFKGLPKPNITKDYYFQEGQYAADSIDSVKQLLFDFQDFINIREGWMPGTFAGLENNAYAFVHVDVDLYQSNLDCCEYFYPRLVPGGVLLFDEYCEAVAHGEKDAVDEFFADKPESPIALPTGQGLVLKTPPTTGLNSSDAVLKDPRTYGRSRT